MKQAMRFGWVLVILYVMIAIGMAFTYREAQILKLVNYLIFGIPTLILYFVLAVVYFKTSRRTLLITVASLVLVIGAWWYFDLG